MSDRRTTDFAGNDIIVSDVKLPRTVPQDPEAVKREQEVRQATAEAVRASQVGRGPSPDELAALRQIEAEDLRALQQRPARYALSTAERIEALERKVDSLLELVSAVYNKVGA